MTEPKHDGVYKSLTQPARDSHPSSSKLNLQQPCPKTSVMFPIGLLQWAQKSSLVANSPQLSQLLSPSEEQWQTVKKHQDVEGLLVSMNSGFDLTHPVSLGQSTEQDDAAYNDEFGSDDEEFEDGENENEEDSRDEKQGREKTSFGFLAARRIKRKRKRRIPKLGKQKGLRFTHMSSGRP